MTDRRSFFGSIAGLMGLPLIALSQGVRVPGKIGYVHMRTVSRDSPTLAALRPVWQRLGYVEGESFLLRSAGDHPARIPQIVEELVRLNVGAIIVVGAETVRLASRTTKTLPIVAIDLETDPVRAGLAASFARPGGNVTGLFVDQPSLAGKWIDLLREATPGIERLGLLWDPTTGPAQLEIAETAARAKGLATTVIELRGTTNFDDALRELSGRPATGIVHLTSPGFAIVVSKFATAAQKYRLPSISSLKAYARAGVLLTYGTIQEDYFPRAIVIADKILRGASPQELPIERPDRFELSINLRTAKSLGVKIPESLILRADEVIR